MVHVRRNLNERARDRVDEAGTETEAGEADGQAVVLAEVEKAEERARSSRAALSDARAALRHASEAVEGHRGLAMAGEV